MPALTAAARAYDRAQEQAKAAQAAKAQIEYQKSLMDIQERMRETPEGRITEAEELARRAEQVRQQREGIPMGEVASEAALRGGMNLLEASRAQGEYDVNQRVLATRQAAIENILAGGRGLVPTADISFGGVSQTVPAESMALTSDKIQQNVYRVRVKRLTEAYIDDGQDPDTAARLARQKVREDLYKDESSNKTVVLGPDGQTTKTYGDKEAREAIRDPDVPESIKEQLRAFIGPEKKSTAPSWINTRLGR